MSDRLESLPEGTVIWAFGRERFDISCSLQPRG
jgi:hypothetical protein